MKKETIENTKAEASDNSLEAEEKIEINAPETDGQSAEDGKGNDVAEFLEDPVGADEPNVKPYVAPPTCENKPQWLHNVEKYGLVPMVLCFATSIIFSVLNAYTELTNSMNMLFMGIGCLLFAIYECIFLYHSFKCACSVCVGARKMIYIKIAIGVLGFAAGLTAYLVFSLR